MTNNNKSIRDRLAAARHRFGRMLYAWRTQNGWSGKTAGLWKQACPDVLPFQVASSTWTNFETDKAYAPNPETFVAFELMNQALLSGEVGVIADRTLRDRVQAARPWLHADGEPWKAGDFFDCFVGALEPPEDLRPEACDPARTADQAREIFHSHIEEHQARPVSALMQMMKASQLSPEHQAAAEDVLLSGGPFPCEESARAVLVALRAWAG